MMKLLKTLIIAILGGSIMSFGIQAKRLAPAEIKPIEKNGFLYFQERDSKTRSDSYSVYISCKNLETGAKVWKTKIYEKEIDPRLEFDAQDIYLKTVELKDGQLVAVDENGTEYRIDLNIGKLVKPKHSIKYKAGP